MKMRITLKPEEILDACRTYIDSRLPTQGFDITCDNSYNASELRFDLTPVRGEPAVLAAVLASGAHNEA